MVYAEPIFNLPSGIRFARAFLAFLLAVAPMAIQRTARLTIGPNGLIDALCTQSKPLGGFQPTRNLLWTPLLTQIRFDALDKGRPHLGHLGLLATTHQRFLVGLVGR